MRIHIFLLLSVISIAASPVCGEPVGSPAQPAALDAPAPAPVDLSERVRLSLEKRCAGCHERDKLAIQPAGGGFDFVTHLDRLVGDRSLVAPGRPDSSLIYAMMVNRHVSLEGYGALGHEAPTAEEVDDVRQWILGLSRAAVTCAGRRRMTLARSGEVIAALVSPGGEALKSIRFISLAKDHNACASPQEMRSRVAAVRELVSVLRVEPGAFDLPFAADDAPILAVRLTDLGWSPAEWDTMAAHAGAPQLKDEKIISAYGTATPLIGAEDLADAARRLGAYAGLLDATGALASLLRDGRAQVGLAQAAADLGVAPSALPLLLARGGGEGKATVQRLRQGSMPAQAWRRLRAVTTVGTGQRKGGLAYAVPTPIANDEEPLDVGVWTERVAYERGDLLTLNAVANRDCNLTVINVDTRGQATVLFPSDSNPDNAVKANKPVRIPSEVEPYQLRVTEAGTESFVAICNTQRKRLIGIDQDFETQRFTSLGDWQAFLKTAQTRETLIGRKDTPRRRRTRRPPAPTVPVVPGSELEARAAIYVKVE